MCQNVLGNKKIFSLVLYNSHSATSSAMSVSDIKMGKEQEDVAIIKLKVAGHILRGIGTCHTH